MGLSLAPCAGCGRHVYTDEPRCPFCQQALGPPRRVAQPSPLLSRAAQLAWRVTLGGLAVACSGSDAAPARPPQSPPKRDAVQPAASAQEEKPVAAKPEQAEPPRSVVAIYGDSTVEIHQRVAF